MESIYPELALCGRKNECARTDTVFFSISEVSEGTVSLLAQKGTKNAILSHIWPKIATSETTLFSSLYSKEPFCINQFGWRPV